MWYTYSQSNPGGYYERPALYVVIEADDADHADLRATEYGVYFDGIDKGLDCDCCNDRWYRADENDRYDVPSVYGRPIDEDRRPDRYVKLLDWRGDSERGRRKIDQIVPVAIVVHRDGSIDEWDVINNTWQRRVKPTDRA